MIAFSSRALRPVAVAIVIAIVLGTLLALFGPHWLRSWVRIVAVYDAAAVGMLCTYCWKIWHADADETKRHAAADDPGRNVAALIVFIGVLFGFVSALSILARGPSGEPPGHDALIDALGFGAVIAGWFLIHMTFLFRYAHLYYRDRDREPGSDRGLTFPGDEPPNDLDFAYFAFVIGMTFQVSDVQITSRNIRRLVLAHGLVSFGYSTAILALVVNLVSGLLH
ncbi:MAG TPA: DUF1345 domain-containing protein [Candidatus Tumulicola sp.]|jgi:uncharacterized membrane protein